MSEVASEQAARDQWGTKVGFILAAMGSAIGLGNIWRYPYVVYENGGGAFLIPYFVAIATAALPILILEYALGHRFRNGAPFALRSINRRFESLGWFQVAVAFFITTYYMVVLAWCLSYLYYAFGQQWGEDTAGFFIGSYLSTAGEGDPASFWDVGAPQWKVLLPLVIAWAIVLAIMVRGVRKGIEAASKVLMPVLIVMLVLIVLQALTLDGAVQGLDVLFTPDFGALGDPTVWIAAYGHVFFSMSIAFGIMIAYSSYLPRRTDLTNTGFIVGLSNAGFEFLAAIGVFAVLGFLAAAQGAAVTEVAGTGGVGLAFISFPTIINTLPALNTVFGLLFFGTLFFAGLTSAVSIMESVIAPVREKFGLGRGAAVAVIAVPAVLISLLYTTRGGLFYLDTADHFLNNFGIVVGGLLEVVLIAWVARQVGTLANHVDAISYFRTGAWWKVSLLVITPVLLGAMTIYNFYTEVTTRYEDYPASGLLVIGWGVFVLCLVLGLAFSMLRDRGPVTGLDLPAHER